MASRFVQLLMSALSLSVPVAVAQTGVQPGLAAVEAVPGQGAVLDSPFKLDADAGRKKGIVALTLESDAHVRLRSAIEADQPILITGFPLTARRRVDLSLRPVSLLTAGARAQVVGVDGEVRRLVPQVVLLEGRVAGERGSYAYLAISPTMANGYFILDHKTHILSSGNSEGSHESLTVAEADMLFDNDPANPWTCQVLGGFHGPLSDFAGGSADPRTLLVPRVRIADLFVECDHQYRDRFDSAEEAADYALTLLGAVSSIYRRDLGAELRIPDGYLRVWEAVPPWGVVDDFEDIYAFRDWWSSGANPLSDIPRAAVKLLTSPVFGGVAWVPGICSHTYGYSVSSVNGYFPFPLQHTSPGNWDPIVVAHELGHNFGSLHTFDYGPPIECEDGSGPDNGTIMSYCHLEPGGLNNVGLRFHARVQQNIRNNMSGFFCMETVTIQPGDYDHDGDLDDSDLAAFDTCLELEFHASGCLETFDFDNDDQITLCDRDTMLGLIDPKNPPPFVDCNDNGEQDICDLVWGDSEDCDTNDVPDECQDTSEDCNENGIWDVCDLANGTSGDMNGNGVPDDCEADRIIRVDDDAPDDPGPGNPLVSDPAADGTVEHPYDAIQDAIDVAVAGNQIVLADGIYTGLGNKDLDLLGRAITVRSENGPENCILDAGGVGRGFYFHTGEPPEARVEGLTITGGGGINRGGAIYCSLGSSPTLRNCLITGNSSDLRGGGVFCSSGGLTLQNCIVTGNSASYGGGVYSSGSVTIQHCTIAGNSASNSGGGIYKLDGSLTVENCLIVSNTAGSGGGMYDKSSSSGSGDLAIRNCTIVGNTAVLGGGGGFFANKSHEPTIHNSILWGNAAAGLGQEIHIEGFYLWPTTLTVAYSDVAGGEAAVSIGNDATLYWSDGNLGEDVELDDPKFVDPAGPDGDPDTWEDNDHHLSGVSPCMDAGQNDYIVDPDETDIDGQPRIVDGDADEEPPGSGVWATVDMGADEYRCEPYGDVAPSFSWQPSAPRQPDLDDILCVLDDFSDGPEVSGCAASVGSTDLAPCDGDGIIDEADVIAILDTFAGNAPCGDVCP